MKIKIKLIQFIFKQYFVKMKILKIIEIKGKNDEFSWMYLLNHNYVR